LAHFAGLADGTEARTLIRQLNQRYDEAGRAFRIEEVAGGFQLLTRPQFAPWLRRLEYIPAEVRLSAPAMETVAVVAYRQPVLRAEIEAIRGVSCGEILRQLLERDLVRIGGRSDELGRPYLYTTTKRFLKLFGLQSLEQLPRADVLCARDSSAQPVVSQDAVQDVRDDPSQEEKSEVRVTSPAPMPADEVFDAASAAPVAQATSSPDRPAGQFEADFDDVDDDFEEYDDDEEDWDEEEDWEDEDEEFDDDDDYDEEYEEDEDEEEDPYEDEDYEDEEWEEVDDDEEYDEEEDEEDEEDDDDEEDWDEEEDWEDEEEV
jgi:segregation and condensation protein B